MPSSSTGSTRIRPARRSSRPQTSRLGTYLVAGLGATTGVAATSDAAIIQIDIGPSGFNIGGVNGGVAAGTTQVFDNFPFAGQGAIGIANAFGNVNAFYNGLFGAEGSTEGAVLWFANGGMLSPPYNLASPVNFAKDAPIGGTTPFGIEGIPLVTLFQATFSSLGTVTSPDFGPDSYMGFKTASGNYGWLEVTWTSAANEFQILSGAYESVPGTTILAGQLAPVPEPSTLAMGGVAALVCGGAALRRWRQQRRT